MNWIRVDVGIASDPKLHQFAKALKVKRSDAIGLFVSTLCQFPDHARDGNVETIDAETLAEWAGWKGKAGDFASAFRRVFCDGSGTVAAWEKHNGAPLRKAKTDADRKRESRGRRTDVPPDVAEMSGVRDETNETRRDAVAVEVQCDSKKQLAVMRPTPYSARGRGGLTPLSRVVADGSGEWREVMKALDRRPS